MGVTDFFAGEIITELLKLLYQISRKACLCKSTAEQLMITITESSQIIREVKYSGNELPEFRQFQLDRFSEDLTQGLELARKVLASGRWNVYRNHQLARKMEKLEKKVSRFLQSTVPLHVMADVSHIRAALPERFDRLEQKLDAMKIGVAEGGGRGGGWVGDAVWRMEEQKEALEGCFGNFSVGLDLGKTKVKDMLIGGAEGGGIIGICGMGGSGKTTLANELCRDEGILSYFSNKVLFLTVSQSPNVDQIRANISSFLSGSETMNSFNVVPQWNFQFEWKNVSRSLVVLDDVWSESVLEQLIFKVPGCTILVVSRFKFSKLLTVTYDVELLTADEAKSLFCFSAFGQMSIPLGANENLVRQIVNECERLPLALKVIGTSLREQPEMFWQSALKKLAKGEPICESHENKLLERMAISVEYLRREVKECFLDLGSFPEDKKIPLDVLINMWVEIHDLDENEAFAVLVELSNKNLITLVKDARAGDMYTSYYEISVTQHDVLRDVALHLSNKGNVNDRKRLLMPKREATVPKEWERNAHKPFDAQIVSIHTGEMDEMSWFPMEFPKAEVLILNFTSKEYALPPFIENMPNLRAIIIINYSTSNSTLHNFSVLSNSTKLRSIWLEKVVVPQLATMPLISMCKMSLILCKMNNCFDQTAVDLPQVLPSLTELMIDHCDDLYEIPSSICRMSSMKSLSITNCHNLRKLPENINHLKFLQILRLYACLTLKALPAGVCELAYLKYLDIAQCVNLKSLPEKIGSLVSLEKIDMTECSQILELPRSVESLWGLRRVICDEDISWLWKDAEKTIPGLYVQVAEKCFSLDWLDQ